MSRSGSVKKHRGIHSQIQSREAASILRGVRYTFRGLSSDANGSGMLKDIHLKKDLNLVLTTGPLPTIGLFYQSQPYLTGLKTSL